MRITPEKRIELAGVAEKEILKYKDDHAAWHKHIHNIVLDPIQVVKCMEMDNHPHTVDFSARRIGKTTIKEYYLLWWCATHPDQEVGIVAPRLAQSLINLNYHLDAIRRSEILKNYIGRRSNRQAIADTYYQFSNRSITRAYGVMSNADGGDMTAISLEEVDDMPKERLFSRFLLMLGAARRAGAKTGAKNDPQIRITGVYKGADTLSDLVSSKKFHILPTINKYLGIKLGILKEDYLKTIEQQLSPDEYIRQLLCQNVTAKNFIYETAVHKAMQKGLETGIGIEEPTIFMEYQKKGLVSFGYDASGHGEGQYASKHALIVCEKIESHISFIFAKLWPAGTDDTQVKKDIVSFWRYFRPDVAIGDAFGIGMLSSLNDDLYREGLTRIDRETLNTGQSVASNWSSWAFQPLRFEGGQKHQMAQVFREIFHQERAILPYLEDTASNDIITFTHQIPNILSESSKKSYATYRMANPKIGDDLFDAGLLACWGIYTRQANTETIILTRHQTTQQLIK